MMADELLNAQDLIAAKKHDTFHSEVITGKVGGVSTGANIDYATNAVTAQVQKTLPKILDDLDWSYVGLFSDGVTFTDKTDFAVDAVGTQWIYTGSLPFSATAGTVPNEPTYQVVHVRDHNSFGNRNAAGAHDQIYDRHVATAAEVASLGLSDGAYIWIDEREFSFKVINGTANGFDKIDAGFGLVASLIQMQEHDVRNFGAKPSDADSTAAINAAIAFIPKGGSLSGGGLEYNTRSCLIKSDMTLKNIKFKTVAGNLDFVAPVSIIAESTPVYVDGQLYTGNGPISNVNIINVYIDGNRANQTSIISPAEDGGRCGIRILGKVNNIKIRETEAKYCAGDGLEFFSGDSKPPTDNPETLCFQDVLIENCNFSWNRRHGIAADSLNVYKQINTDCKYNGLDLNTTDPLSSGTRGARFNGNLYGRPYDIEGYGVGSAVFNVEITGGDNTKNIGGALIYDLADPNAAGFIKRKGISIIGGFYDASTPTDYSLSIYASAATALDKVYSDINITGAYFDTYVQIQGVDGINVAGGSIKATYAANTYFAQIAKSKNWFFNGVAVDKFGVVYDSLPVQVSLAHIIGNPTISNESLDIIGFTGAGWVYRYSALFTPTTSGPSLLKLNPSSGTLTQISSSFFSQSTGAVATSGMIHESSGLQVGYSGASGEALNVNLVFEVLR